MFLFLLSETHLQRTFFSFKSMQLVDSANPIEIHTPPVEYFGKPSTGVCIYWVISLYVLFFFFSSIFIVNAPQRVH